MAAARPLAADGKLDAESDPIYLCYTQCSVFSLPIFKSNDFSDLVAKVRVAQDLQVEVQETLGEARSESSEMLKMMRKMFAQSIAMNARQEKESLEKRHFEREDSRKRESPQAEELQTSPAGVPIVSVCCNGLTTKGTARKRAKASHRLDHVGGKFVQSQDNVTAQDFWNEYEYGPSGTGEDSLRRKEEETHGKWRVDVVGVNGKKGSKFKAFWCRHRLIYKFIEVVLQKGEKSEAEAIHECQAIFDGNSSRNGKPKMGPVNVILKGKIMEMGHSPQP